MKIALAQLGSLVRDINEALQRMAQVYRLACANGAELVVFPEIALPITDMEGGGTVMLKPADLKRLAAQVGPVALLAGGAFGEFVIGQNPLEQAAVFSLKEGETEILKFRRNPAQVMEHAGRIIETMILRNCWQEPEPAREFSRPYSLNALHAAVGLDFYVQCCVREPVPIQPLKAYWHLVRPGDDCVSDNGIISATAETPGSIHSETGDDFVLVALDTLWQQLREHHPKTKLAEANLILGCATTLPVMVGASEMVIEVQRSWRQYRSGMMFRDELTDHEGMLFVLPRPQRAAFYMRNTKVPLTCAYLDAAGVIREIHDLVPFDGNPVRGMTDNTQFVLEANHGWFSRQDVKIGATLTIHNQSPNRMFFGQGNAC